MADIIVGQEVNPNPNSGVKVRYVDQGDGTWALKVAATAGGGGGGASLADVLLTDTNNILFVGRDNGTTVTFFRLDTLATYTPVGTIKTAASSFTATTNASSTALEASHVLKSSAGVLKSVSICNTGTTAQYYQLHDSATVPADTAVPKSILYLPAKGTGGWDYGNAGRTFASGIVICNSSTAATKTIGAADSFFDAQVV